MIDVLPVLRSRPARYSYFSKIPHSSGDGDAPMPNACNPQPRIVTPAFFPVEPKSPGAARLSFVSILHLPLVTMQKAPLASKSQSLMSIVVQGA